MIKPRLLQAECQMLRHLERAPWSRDAGKEKITQGNKNQLAECCYQYWSKNYGIKCACLYFHITVVWTPLSHSWVQTTCNSGTLTPCNIDGVSFNLSNSIHQKIRRISRLRYPGAH